MNIMEFEAKNVEDAQKKAAIALNRKSIDDLKIEILDNGRSGLFSFGSSRLAKIRVYCDVVNETVGPQVRTVLETLFEKMDIDAEIKELKETATKIYVELTSENSSGIIIGKKGTTLEALQFIVNLMISNDLETDKKIILDIEDYRAKRERTLKKMSKDLATKVSKTGRPWTLEPMNPFERRLVHLTLQDDNRVYTKSEGQGAYRKVKIYPAERR